MLVFVHSLLSVVLAGEVVLEWSGRCLVVDWQVTSRDTC